MAYDLDGQEVVTTALRELVNLYPALDGDEIAYSTLADDSGKAMFPTSGSAIISERKDVTGATRQVCEYPFIVIYRATGLSENRKAKVKEWLDNLGRWLEKQPIIVSGTEYQLTEYPRLTRGREFKKISRATPAFLDSVRDNGAENWAINLTATYENEF